MTLQTWWSGLDMRLCRCKIVEREGAVDDRADPASAPRRHHVGDKPFRRPGVKGIRSKKGSGAKGIMVPPDYRPRVSLESAAVFSGRSPISDVVMRRDPCLDAFSTPSNELQLKG